jgi:hypothetical protein
MAPPGARAWGAAALLLAAFLVQCLLALPFLTPSFDEHSHLPAGYTYWKTGELRLNPQHPPLVKLLAAAPLLALRPRVDWSDPSWAEGNEWRFGHVFFYDWGNDLDRMLLWARLPMVALGGLLGVYVFLWSARRFGTKGGVLSLLLYAFCPNLIAHARFVTMDVALATFLTISLYYAWRYGQDGSRTALVLSAVALGLALATKFSAPVIVPVVLAMVFRKERRVGPPLLVAALAAAVLWAAYLLGDPMQYLNGLRRVNQDHPAEHRYFLLGQYRAGGFGHYFLAAFLMKTPIPALIAFLAASVLAWRTRAATGRDDLALLVPAAVFFIATSIWAHNLGVRYVLPVYPLLFIFAGRLADALPSRPAARVAAAALALWLVLGAWRSHPDQLAYFNEAAGGPAKGYRRLDDSNVDWIQDLKRLKTFLDSKGIGPVYVCMHMRGNPPFYGIQAEPIEPVALVYAPPAGHYALSAHCLSRIREYNGDAGRELDWLTRFPVVGRVGHSFHVFEVR